MELFNKVLIQFTMEVVVVVLLSITLIVRLFTVCSILHPSVSLFSILIMLRLLFDWLYCDSVLLLVFKSEIPCVVKVVGLIVVLEDEFDFVRGRLFSFRVCTRFFVLGDLIVCFDCASHFVIFVERTVLFFFIIAEFVFAKLKEVEIVEGKITNSDVRYSFSTYHPLLLQWFSTVTTIPER